MYSYEQRMKAVKLYIQYDFSVASVIRELGYPTSNALTKWYQEYQERGCTLHENIIRKPKFAEEQKQTAINYYLEHGKCVSRTVRVLGYPSRTLLNAWLAEAIPDFKQDCKSSKSLVNLTQDQKEQAVIDLCTRASTAEKVASEHGVSRFSLYSWKRQMLNKESVKPMPKNKKQPTKVLPEDVTELQQEVSRLEQQAETFQQQVYRLQLEKDILEKAAEVIKKDQGISLDSLTNREKAIVIDALRDKYLLKELLSVFHMAKSSYCYQQAVIKGLDKYVEIREKVKETFSDSSSRYGYRRIHASIKNTGVTVSEKVIRRIMKEEKLTVPNVKRKKYSSYNGEISPEVANVIERDFHADKPNTKWLTDITEFSIPAGKIYLSPIIDCFDGLPVSWTIGTSPDADLVNTMLDEAIVLLNENEHPIIHSDRGCHYRWPGWIDRMDKAELTRSMSKKGCSPDNSACEGFFGRLKNEMFYGYSWSGASINQFIEQLDTYIHWYAEKRIKLSLGGMSPLDYRRNLGLAV